MYAGSRPGPIVKPLKTASTGLEPFTGDWGTGLSNLYHLLRRTTFGVSKTDVDALSQMSVPAAVNSLLTVPASSPGPPVNNYNATYADPTGILPGETWVAASYGNGTVNAYRVQSLKAWWIGLMLDQSASVVEKMTLFWHNHFSTETGIVGDARYCYKHNALLRQYALGNFKDLTKQITIDPAMLLYLNGYVNSASAPDENYGRELQELFTVGKGPDSHYTEDDVKAAARALTGWRINSAQLTSYFNPNAHDTTNKQFSSFYNNTVITGKTGQDGATEVDDLLSMIFAQQEVAKFICRKIYRWFVYYAIDQTIEDNIITPLADIFRNSNYEIVPVLSALLNSAHFFDPLNVGCMIKSPVDFCVGLCRQYNVGFPASTDPGTQYGAWDFIRSYGTLLGMNIGDPPNVAGWPAYYQVPEFYELWVNSDTLPRRNQFSDTLISTNGRLTNGFKVKIDPFAFVQRVSMPYDPNVLISSLAQLVLAVSLTADQLTFLKGVLIPGLPDYEWTNEWTNYVNNPTDPMSVATVQSRLQALLKTMMDLAEYQLS